MAAGGVRGITNKQQAKENIKAINADLVNLAKTIKKQNEDLTAIMKGDTESGGAYWNGSEAAEWYQMAIKNLNQNIEDYCDIYKVLKEYTDAFEGIK